MRALVTVCLALLLSPAAHADEATDRATILRTYDQLRASLAQQSVAPLEAAYARDAIVVNANGTQEPHIPARSTTIQFGGGKRQERSDVRVVRLGVGPDMALAVVSLRIGMSVPAGGAARYNMEVVTDTLHDWRRTQDGWRIVRETIISNSSVTDMASLQAAINANARASMAQNGGGGGGISSAQVMNQIQGATAMSQQRTANQMQIQQGWNNNSTLRGLHGALYGP